MKAATEKHSEEFKEKLGQRNDDFMAGIDEMLNLLDSDDDEGEALEALLEKMTKELENDMASDLKNRAERQGITELDLAEIEEEYEEELKA